jgi:signal transduction histidine kinase
LWDFHPDFEVPRELLQTTHRRNLFLVDRGDLKEFGARGLEFAFIVLKPITLPALASALEHSTRFAVRNELESVKADRDEVLHGLINANLRLQEYDQDRTKFLAQVVHDFRAPITALSGYCRLLLGEQLGSVNQWQKEALQRMQSSSARLSRMAADMLELSTNLQVERSSRIGPVDVCECVAQAMHEIGPTAQAKKIAISVECTPPPEPIWFEEMRLEDILLNLLDNACRHTPKWGSIEIHAYPFYSERWASDNDRSGLSGHRLQDCSVPNVYRIDVLDSGPGIPSEHIDHIFEEYTSLKNGGVRSSTGLGLAICRSVLARHQGAIWAENAPSGTLFSFVVPLRPAARRLDADPLDAKREFRTAV